MSRKELIALAAVVGGIALIDRRRKHLPAWAVILLLPP